MDNIRREVLQKSKNVNGTQGEKRKKIERHAAGEQQFCFFEHPLDGKVTFVEKSMKIDGDGAECLNLCGEAEGTTENNYRFSGKSWAFSVNNPKMCGKT